MIDISKTVSSLEKDYIRKLLKQGKRIDGRGLFEYREVTVTAGFVPKAEGSADVHIGDSRVMCGVKYDIGRPYSDNPDKGVEADFEEIKKRDTISRLRPVGILKNVQP